MNSRAENLSWNNKVFVFYNLVRRDYYYYYYYTYLFIGKKPVVLFVRDKMYHILSVRLHSRAVFPVRITFYRDMTGIIAHSSINTGIFLITVLSEYITGLCNFCFLFFLFFKWILTASYHNVYFVLYIYIIGVIVGDRSYSEKSIGLASNKM